MEFVKLNEREELILQAVVHAYIMTAEPAGSRAIVKRFNLDISPATVRNVMADLEEAGYLTQKHASSGRVPTDRGYRYYVDFLMRVQELTQTERRRVEKDLNERLSDADEILKQTSHLLALISHQTSIIEGPSLSEARVRRLEVMPLEPNRLVVLLADNYGRVRTRVLPVIEPVSSDDAARLTRFLNEHLQGVSIEQLGNTLEKKLEEFIHEERKLATQALHLLTTMPNDRGGQLFLDGATQLFEQPEFRDVGRAREVFGLLEERDRVMDLLRTGAALGATSSARVIIGRESSDQGMEELSIVTAPYSVGDRPIGTLAVLGPRRMPYWRLTGMVEYTANVVGRLLTRLAG